MSVNHKDYWSDCGQAYFLDGWGWGLTEKCQCICLGKEEDILKFFETEELNGNIYPKQKEVLGWILELRKEEGYGEQSTARTNKGCLVGAGNNGASRRKPKATRQPTPRKRLTMRSSKQKGTSLLR